MMEEVNSTMIYLIYCKNFCKCHHVLPASTTIKKFLNLIKLEIAKEKNKFESWWNKKMKTVILISKRLNGYIKDFNLFTSP
jgi:hypothetical protein